MYSGKRWILLISHKMAISICERGCYWDGYSLIRCLGGPRKGEGGRRFSAWVPMEPASKPQEERRQVDGEAGWETKRPH